MKTNINLKDFLDKETLQKTLEAKVKKAVMWLAKNPGSPLPFLYEYAYFDDGRSFLSVGISKELYNVFKKQRSKGQGKDAGGNPVKVNKKHVAYGQLTLNEEGIYAFLPEGGFLKKMQLKQAIKDWGIYKKQIGSNFTILTKAVEDVPTEETVTDDQTTAPNSSTEESTGEETTNDTTTDQPETEISTGDQEHQKQRVIRGKKQKKVEEGVGKIDNALGRTDSSKLKAGIEKLKQALVDLETEAASDGTIDPQEEAEIKKLKNKLQGLQEHLERIGDRRIKMTPKNRAVVRNKMSEAQAYLEKIENELAGVTV